MKTFYYLFILFLCSAVSGGIFEIKKFSEIYNFVQDKDLVILDIDDTLLVPKQMLGCDEWFQYRLKNRQRIGMDAPSALEETLAEWEAIRHLTQMEIVENQSDEIVRSMQEIGYSVMGLTTQRLTLAARTNQQLRINGFDLTITSPCCTDCYFCLENHGILFRNGILFTSGCSKGESFFTFCEEIGIMPQRIVFVNDKASHLRDLEASAVKRNIPFVGLRYAYSDSRKAAFSAMIADFQFQHSSFEHILSDEEAVQFIKDPK